MITKVVNLNCILLEIGCLKNYDILIYGYFIVLFVGSLRKDTQLVKTYPLGQFFKKNEETQKS